MCSLLIHLKIHIYIFTARRNLLHAFVLLSDVISHADIDQVLRRPFIDGLLMKPFRSYSLEVRML